MDRMFCQPNTDSKALMHNVRSLPTKFSQEDPISFGLLNCKSMLRVFDSSATSYNRPQFTAFNITFRRLEGIQCLFSLEIKIDCELTKSVGYLTTIDFVHKNLLQ